MGFSTTRCLPASMTLTAWAVWRPLGVQTHTASTSPEAHSSSRELNSFTGQFFKNSWALAEWSSKTPVSSASGIREMAVA